MRSIRTVLALVVIFLMIASLFAGCGLKLALDTQSAAATGSKKNETAPEATKEATKEGKPNAEKPKTLTFYSGEQEDNTLKVAQTFEKATGIKTTFVRMSAGEILGRIRAEKEKPQASIWYGGPADSFIAAKGEGLVEAYKSPNAAKISDKFRDADGYWTGIYQGYLGFVYDERFFKEKNLQIPKSWEDLLKPELKGQVMLANPGSSGTAYTMLSTMVQLKGEMDGLEYMKKLNKQIKQYTKSGAAPAQSAGLGECAVGISFLHDGIKYMKEGFTNIRISAPSEGTGYEIGAVAIIKGAPEMEAAKIFVDWCLTPEAQEIGQTTGSFQFLTNPDAKPPKEVDMLKGTKLIDYNFIWSGENKQRLLDAWNKAIKE
jgi:iron(III) transport system substrate-binding protein